MNTPENEPTVGVSLTVKNTSKALEFYTSAFGAEELFRIPTPDGGIAHAEFMLGNTRIFISDESEEWHAYAIPEGSKSSSLLAVTTDSCDKSFQQAIDAGGEGLSDPTVQFWGAKTAIVKDPFGYRWVLREVLEEVSSEEMAKRAQKLFAES